MNPGLVANTPLPPFRSAWLTIRHLRWLYMHWCDLQDQMMDQMKEIAVSGQMREERGAVVMMPCRARSDCCGRCVVR